MELVLKSWVFESLTSGKYFIISTSSHNVKKLGVVCPVCVCMCVCVCVCVCVCGVCVCVVSVCVGGSYDVIVPSLHHVMVLQLCSLALPSLTAEWWVEPRKEANGT